MQVLPRPTPQAFRTVDQGRGAAAHHTPYSEAIVIDRSHGAPAFGPRAVALVKMLHDEIAPLVGVRLTTEDHLSRDGLIVHSANSQLELACHLFLAVAFQQN